MPKSSTKTVRAILEAANRIVQEQGVEHLTLDQTAREAGVSKGGLLYHFPSKEALIEGMILYYLERFSEDYRQAAARDQDAGRGRWTRAYLYTTYEDYQRIPRMTSGLLAAMGTNPELLAPMQRAFAEWVGRLENDGVDPTITTIIRLAVDGLWLVELFGLAQPDLQRRAQVLAALDALSRKTPAELGIQPAGAE
ncbi:MAG: TetR/AcrR family transcriptional regulator [Chloroflexi bacterium]|jgi:AcrR family transcriptional regulator|nr:TetR/AcrR family transcriptional regulator [Chloroflexota bacterium]